MDLTIRELANVCLSETNTELLGDVLCEFWVTTARDEDQTALSE